MPLLIRSLAWTGCCDLTVAPTTPAPLAITQRQGPPHRQAQPPALYDYGSCPHPAPPFLLPLPLLSPVSDQFFLLEPPFIEACRSPPLPLFVS